jgi:hypothetical protein
MPDVYDHDRYDGHIPRPSWPIGFTAERLYLHAWTEYGAGWPRFARATLTQWAHHMGAVANAADDLELPVDAGTLAWMVDVEAAYGIGADAAADLATILAAAG